MKLPRAIRFFRKPDHISFLIALVFVIISNFLSNLLVIRVSSEIIVSTVFKVFIALSVISSKLPIGVETTYNDPTFKAP